MPRRRPERNPQDGRYLKGPPKLMVPAEPPDDGQERDFYGNTMKEAIKTPFSDPVKAREAGMLGLQGRVRLSQAKRLVMEIATGAYQEALAVALEEMRMLLWKRDNMSEKRFGIRNRMRLWNLCGIILKHTEKVLPASLEVSGSLTVAEVPLLPPEVVKELLARYAILKARKVKALPPPSGVEQGDAHETESPAPQSSQLKSAGHSPAED